MNLYSSGVSQDIVCISRLMFLPVYPLRLGRSRDQITTALGPTQRRSIWKVADRFTKTYWLIQAHEGSQQLYMPSYHQRLAQCLTCGRCSICVLNEGMSDESTWLPRRGDIYGRSLYFWLGWQNRWWSHSPWEVMLQGEEPWGRIQCVGFGNIEFEMSLSCQGRVSIGPLEVWV